MQLPARCSVGLELRTRRILLRVAELHPQRAGKECFEAAGDLVFVHAQGVSEKKDLKRGSGSDMRSLQKMKEGSGNGFSHLNSRAVTGSMGGGGRGKGASNPRHDAKGGTVGDGEALAEGATGSQGRSQADAAELRRRTGPTWAAHLRCNSGTSTLGLRGGRAWESSRSRILSAQ